MSGLLENMRQPADVKGLAASDLPVLAREIRAEMLASVARTGGHLASSLGAVELTIALLRIFDPERDRILWDVGHQSYAWKMLTGRRARLGTLRRLDGLSGFCCPEETACDAFVSGHAGTALAVAEGFAAARALRGGDEQIVAVVGDAALANGESLEALKELARAAGKIILVVNDNAQNSSARSDAPVSLGGVREIGPVDGHDVAAVERVLRAACAETRSVAVRVVTQKGHGFPPAERDPAAWHGVGAFDLARPAVPEVHADWSAAFGAALVGAAWENNRICALTAAMRDGTGLADFARQFPARFFDVGICEELLVTYAAGLAKAGCRPVVAVYSTFLQRAIDQVMHDVCLLRLPVVFAVDRAGCVGHDGRTHHGMFDIAMLRCLPNLTICQPADESELRDMLDAALQAESPWVIRYPRGPVPTVCHGEKTPLELGRARIVSDPEAPLQIWALGDWVEKACAVAERLQRKGVRAGVVDARFVKPFDAELLARQRADGARIVSLENGCVVGGFGEAIGADLRLGWPDVFVAHGSVEELERLHGLDIPALVSHLLTFNSQLQTSTSNFKPQTSNFEL